MPPREEKKLSAWYEERKEFRTRLTISLFMILFVIGVAGGMYTSRRKIANIFRQKEVEIKSQVVGFKERSGSWGPQAYTASAQKIAYAGHRTFTPTPPCSDMLVITLKPSLKNTEVVEKLFVSIDQAIIVKVTPTKIIVNRTCDELRDLDQLWSLDDAWNIVEPILSKYFNPKK